MKKNLAVVGLGALIVIFGSSGWSQDIPGFSLGGFYEYRVENDIGGDNLSFSYYGARLTFRDERWINFFIEGGGESLSFNPVKDETTGSFGIGATFWLMRYEYGYGPFDLGIYGSVHYADYSNVKLKTTLEKTGLKHYYYLAQLVIRGEVNQNFWVFLRGGILGTKLDPDDKEKIPIDDIDKFEIKPAINTGVEIKLVDNLVATLELNYSEGVGGGIHLDYWF